MEKVTGIGGFFFRSRQPKVLAAWYRDHLGINPIPDSAEAEPWEQQAGTTAFSPFPEDSKYFPQEKQWMLNLRVSSMDAMVAQLRAAGITVEVNPDTSFGTFARLYDPEGNAIELWQPE
jgi:glyoxylase I family protein